jgi:hypothetical protein
MLSRAVDFHDKVHSHIKDELNKLIQLNIPEDDALVLVSEDLVLMFDRMFAERMKLFDSQKDRSKVEYVSCILWVSLRCHMVAMEFTEGGIKYNPTISAAFVRFLTKQTGANTSANVSQTLKT